MESVWVEVLRAALAAPFVTAVVLGWRAIRKDRIEGRVSEHDMLDRVRAMLLADLESAKRDRDQLRARVEHLEAAMATDGMLIAGLRTHIDYLANHIAQHLPEGAKRPKPLPQWLREDNA